MALTVARNQTLITGARGAPSVVLSEVTFDNAYAVGGEAFVASDAGLIEITTVLFGSHAGFRPVYTPTSGAGGTIYVYVTSNVTSSAGVGVESSIRDLSTLTVWAVVIGRAA